VWPLWKKLRKKRLELGNRVAFAPAERDVYRHAPTTKDLRSFRSETGSTLAAKDLDMSRSYNISHLRHDNNKLWTKFKHNLSVSTRFGWRGAYLLASFGLYMVDQSTKAWAVRALRFGHDRTIINGFLDLIYAENNGIAFGQLQQGETLPDGFLSCWR